MSSDLQTRDKQNREVDSSEQYAINVIGDRALQSANLVVKESKRAAEKTMGARSVLPRPNSKQNARPNTPRQTPPAAEDLPHIQVTDNNLRLSEESSLTTWESSAITNSLQNQGAALSTTYNSGAAMQTFQAAGQSAGSAGAVADNRRHCRSAPGRRLSCRNPGEG